MRNIAAITLAIVSLVLYQNCAGELNEDPPTEVPGQRIAKPLPGLVDKTQPIDIRPSFDGDFENGLHIRLDNGEVVSDGELSGECFNEEKLSDLNEILEQAQVCQDETLVPEGEEVYCTMEFNSPWLAVHTTSDQDTWVGLGQGNDCPRSPTYLCENNDALQALVSDIDPNQDFGSCP